MDIYVTLFSFAAMFYCGWIWAGLARDWRKQKKKPQVSVSDLLSQKPISETEEFYRLLREIKSLPGGSEGSEIYAMAVTVAAFDPKVFKFRNGRHEDFCQRLRELSKVN